MRVQSLLALSLVASVVAIALAFTALKSEPQPPALQPRDLSTEVRQLEAQMKQLRQEMTQLGSMAANAPADLLQTEDRLQSIETSMAKLQSAMDGISIEQASAERNEQFSAENGYLKADEYFEAGKFAIAAEGYLTFLQAHPNHLDARDIMSRARRAFQKAGYMDKAYWVQEEMISHFPENNFDDLFTLAQMMKSASRFDEAISHLEGAIEVAPTEEDRMWKRVYWAWYHQLRDGNQAGLEAYREVQREVAAGGVTNPRLGERVQEKIDEIEAILATP